LLLNKKTNSENEVKKNGRNRAEDVPSAFAEGLREIAEGDISGPNFLLLFLLVFPVVFPSCVSIRLNFLCFFMLCFQNTVSLSWLVFGFVVLGRYW
jgi:hypothetical protein